MTTTVPSVRRGAVPAQRPPLEAVTATGASRAPVQLHGLTSLRFGAALMIVLAHASDWIPSRAFVASVRSGYLAVDFFFVLSGFVLVWATRPGTSSSGFWLRRVARIYPAHLVLAVAAALLAYASPTPPTPTAVVTGLTLTQSWFPQNEVHYGLNGVAWSLSAEAFFYATFPLWARLMRRRASLLALVAVVVAVAGAVAVLLTPAHSYVYLYTLPVLRLPEFLTGMLLARWVQRGGRLRVPVWAACLLAAAAVALVGVVNPPAHLLGGLSTLPVVVVLILATATADIEGRQRLLGHRWLVRLGEMSFALYLTHQLVDKGFVRFHLVPAGGPGIWVALAAMVAGGLATGWAVERWVEKPGHGLVMSFVRRKEARA